MLDPFMRQLAKELELEGTLATEVPGVYAFPLDEELSAIITEIPHGFAISCAFSERPEDNEEEFYIQALFANLYGQGTEGCVLGLDPEGKQLTLSKKIDYSIEYQEFRDILEDFLNGVDFWREESKAYGTKSG